MHSTECPNTLCVCVCVCVCVCTTARTPACRPALSVSTVSQRLSGKGGGGGGLRQCQLWHQRSRSCLPALLLARTAQLWPACLGGPREAFRLSCLSLASPFAHPRRYRTFLLGKWFSVYDGCRSNFGLLLYTAMLASLFLPHFMFLFFHVASQK